MNSTGGANRLGKGIALFFDRNELLETPIETPSDDFCIMSEILWSLALTGLS